jgi:FkbM family methyltransferase
MAESMFVALRHTLKRIVYSVLPDGVQEAIDRRFYYQRFRRGDLSNEDEFELLSSLVRPGDTVLDIGANLGGYAVRLSALVGEQGLVHCFEPVPRTCRLLRFNIARLAPHRNVIIHEAAVSDAAGRATLHLPMEGQLANYYTPSLRRRPGARPIEVRTVALDDLFRNAPSRIAFMKIDAEGAEALVLRGALEIMRLHRPAVLCEVAGSNEGAVSTLMGSLNYTAFRYRMGQLSITHVPDGLGLPNYIFLPSR